MKYIYTGVFFDSSELAHEFGVFIGKKTLSNIIENPHVTFTYKPKDADVKEDLFGVPVKFKVVGYACDGKNQGLQVDVLAMNGSLESEYNSIKAPHITISVSEDGRPVDTGKLNFEPVSTPFVLVGHYGAFTNKGVILENPNTITVYDFCRHKTQAAELCVLCDGGWIVGAVWIDYEDIFRIPDSLRGKAVKSDHWEELTIVNEQGEKMKIPAHFIDT